MYWLILLKVGLVALAGVSGMRETSFLPNRTLVNDALLTVALSIGLVRHFLRFFFQILFFFFRIQEHNYQSRMYAPLLSMTCCQRSGRETIPLS